MMYYYNYPFSWFNAIVSLLWLIIIVIGLSLLFRWLLKNKDSLHLPTSQTPLDILKTRYAKGEITKVEFEEISSVILNKG
jgi:uncharacterized membrane protein